MCSSVSIKSSRNETYHNFRTAYVQLNKSSFVLNPDLFRVEKAPDITMWKAGINDGLQEFGTYNPPGPSEPGMLNRVSSKRNCILGDHSIHKLTFHLSLVDNQALYKEHMGMACLSA